MFNRSMFDEIPKFSDMRFQYVYDIMNRQWAVYEDNSKIAAIDLEDETRMVSSGVTTLDLEILRDFNIFKLRPEYYLLHFEIPSNLRELPDVYSKILTGAVFVRARNHVIGCNPDDAWPQVEKYLNWLATTDFFTAPASSKYHDSFAGGLCFHCLRVTQRIIDLMHTHVFCDNSKFGDAIFCALTHDLCKINLYESYMRNVKNEETGEWEKVLAYRYTGNPLVNLGHGVSSMFIINKFFKLNTEESHAIRWHMGAYRVSDEEFDELQTSNENFMMVHLLQFADQLSIVKY